MKADAQAMVERMFAELADATRDQSVSVGGGEGETPAIHSVPGALITRIPASRVDGTTVLPNDELMRLRASALPVGTVLKPGDHFMDMADGMQRNIVTAHLDPLGLLWTCAVRRVF
jgi:hypothetical protein